MVCTIENRKNVDVCWCLGRAAPCEKWKLCRDLQLSRFIGENWIITVIITTVSHFKLHICLFFPTFFHFPITSRYLSDWLRLTSPLIIRRINLLHFFLHTYKKYRCNFPCKFIKYSLRAFNKFENNNLPQSDGRFEKFHNFLMF